MLAHLPRLVGRSAEHELLVRAVKAARLGRGGTVFVVGEAGIGKSRLAAHTIDEATTSGMLAVRGRASEFASAVPFRPMAEVILGLTRSGDASQATELVAYRSSLGRLVPDWRAAPEDDGDDGDSLLVLAEAVLRLAVHAARDRGCLIVLEDLHGADPETLAVVEYLMDNLAGRPVLVLGTVRAEPCVALDLARTATHRGSSSLIELTALTDDEVGQSVADRLDVPVDSVPEPVMARLIQGCGGNPFLAEEMLNDMIASGALARTGAGWRVVGDIPARVPAHVVQSLVRRADRLGEEARAVLRAGAMLGQRFPLDVVQRVTYIDDRTLLNHIHAAVAAQLLVPDDAPDWYRFRHALTAEALLDELRPAGRVELARRIADVIEQRYPDLRGPWCQLAAELRLAAGDSTVAGRLFLAAGRRAFADGAAVSAVKLLEQARTLLSDSADDAAFADVLEALLLALLEVGRIDEALTLVDTFDVTGRALGPLRQTRLHCDLAWVAAMAGRHEDGLTQLTAARALAGSPPEDRHAAPIDVVAAYLALDSRQPDSLVVAEGLARRAAVTAERVPLPVVACQAWQLLGVLARWRGFDEAEVCFRRVGVIADEHRMRTWGIRALAFLAVNDALVHGRTDNLTRARNEARRAGAVAFAHGLEADLALTTVLRGEWDQAQALIDDCWPAAIRMRFHDIVRYAAVARAALAAHRGRRAEMEQALADFWLWGGAESHHHPMALGLCQAVCALLEEDAEGAYAVLAQSCDREASTPWPLHLPGRYGLQVLLRAMRSEIKLPECRQIFAAAPGRLRWNRQFVLLAEAVLLGRSGHLDAAQAVAAQARSTAAPFAMARHLGARLVAPAALADGWGEPVAWLREAEEYFHSASVPAVASACRALLRSAGARVNQRRTGRSRVPAALRLTGITAREFDVLELLLDRYGNQQIAQRLHISPRTVEKHVASLIRKTGQADRTALLTFAADELDSGPPRRPAARTR